MTQHAHPALFCYDILVEVFAALDLNDKAGLVACARSAQVCLAWAEPASQAVWTSCSGRSVKELYDLFRAVNNDIFHSRYLPEVRRHSVINTWGRAETTY